jgi:hypothetical protein
MKITRTLHKALAQQDHAIRRAAERYGVKLTLAGYFALCNQIQEQKGKPLGAQSRRVSHYTVEHDGIEMHAVYDRHRRRIVTFLSLGSPVPKKVPA